MIIDLLATTASGLLAGALVTEAMVLVPYWQRMPARKFQSLHHTLGPLLFRFYAPLTIAGTMLPVAAFALQWLTGGAAIWPWGSSALCGLALIGFYFGYFRGANLKFAESDSPDLSAAVLATWARVHGARTVVAVVGFLSAATALTGIIAR